MCDLIPVSQRQTALSFWILLLRVFISPCDSCLSPLVAYVGNLAHSVWAILFFKSKALQLCWLLIPSSKKTLQTEKMSPFFEVEVFSDFFQCLCIRETAIILFFLPKCRQYFLPSFLSLGFLSFPDVGVKTSSHLSYVISSYPTVSHPCPGWSQPQALHQSNACAICWLLSARNFCSELSLVLCKKQNHEWGWHREGFSPDSSKGLCSQIRDSDSALLSQVSMQRISSTRGSCNPFRQPFEQPRSSLTEPDVTSGTLETVNHPFCLVLADRSKRFCTKLQSGYRKVISLVIIWNVSSFGKSGASEVWNLPVIFK